MCSPENDGIATIHYDFSPDVVIQKIDVTAKKDFLFFLFFWATHKTIIVHDNSFQAQEI